MNNYFKSGVYNIICDSCGCYFKSDQVKKRWDGYTVCEQDWETRHPQMLLKARPEKHTVVNINKEPDPVEFQNVCYIDGITAYADMAVADCSQADKATPAYSFLLTLTSTARR